MRLRLRLAAGFLPGLILGTILAMIPVCATAQPAGSATLLVLSKQDHALVIVDPASLQVLARVPVGDDPHEVSASSDGKTAYVSNYGFGQFHTLTVVDLVNRKLEKTVDLLPLKGPHGLDFVDGKLWFTVEVNKAIGRYDPESGKVDWVLGTGQNRTHMIYVFSGSKRILTTNVNAATVSIMDWSERPAGMPQGPPPGMPDGQGPPPGMPQGMPPGPPPGPPGGDWNETVVPVGRGSEGFDVSPDGAQAWVANAGDGTISVIDIAQKKVTATLAANARGANRLKFAPDGKLALVSAGPNLVIFDVATQKEIKRIAIGHGSGGVLMQPDGARAYVACSGDDYVTVIDLKTLEIVGKVVVGKTPDGLSWAVGR